MYWYKKLQNSTMIQDFFGFGENGVTGCAMTAICDGNTDEAITVWMNSLVGTHSCTNKIHKLCDYVEKTSFARLISHLNDTHKLSFKEIAEIIRPIEEEFYPEHNLDPDEELVAA